jgi:hypothetical protein
MLVYLVLSYIEKSVTRGRWMAACSLQLLSGVVTFVAHSPNTLLYYWPHMTMP